jgi:hypothetical protein
MLEVVFPLLTHWDTLCRPWGGFFAPVLSCGVVIFSQIAETQRESSLRSDWAWNRVAVCADYSSGSGDWRACGPGRKKASA